MVEQQIQAQVIQFASQQLSAAISGQFSGGSAVTGIAGIVATAFSKSNPLLAVAVTAIGGVISSLFSDPAEDLSDSLDLNTRAIDRNTQTLQNVLEQRIGVPTSFSLPAAITMRGALPSGSVVQQSVSITIPIDGRSQNADQIASKVSTILAKQVNLDARRGFGSNVYSLG